MQELNSEARKAFLMLWLIFLFSTISLQQAEKTYSNCKFEVRHLGDRVISPVMHDCEEYQLFVLPRIPDVPSSLMTLSGSQIASTAIQVSASSAGPSVYDRS